MVITRATVPDARPRVPQTILTTTSYSTAQDVVELRGDAFDVEVIVVIGVGLRRGRAPAISARASLRLARRGWFGLTGLLFSRVFDRATGGCFGRASVRVRVRRGVQALLRLKDDQRPFGVASTVRAEREAA